MINRQADGGNARRAVSGFTRELVRRATESGLAVNHLA